MKKIILFLLLAICSNCYSQWPNWEYNPLNPITTYDFYDDSGTYATNAGTSTYSNDSGLLDNINSTEFFQLNTDQIVNSSDTFTGENTFYNTIIGTTVFSQNSDLLDNIDSSEFFQRSTNQTVNSTDTWTGTQTFDDIVVDEITNNVLTSTTANITNLTVSSQATIPINYLGNATYTTQEQFNNSCQSVGRISGGMLTDEGNYYVSIDSGTGFIKLVDVDTSTLYSFDWNYSTGTIVPLNTTRYFGITLNGGTPRAEVKTTDVWNYDTEFPLGSVINQAGVLYVKNDFWQVGDTITNILERFQSEGVERDDQIGGLILGETGTRNLTLTSGKVWSIVNEFDISAKDTSGTDTFYSFYRDGAGGWTRSAGQLTQWDNTSYDDNSGSTITLNANWYANFYVFVEIDATNDGQIMLIYPQSQYANAATAESEAIPTFPSTWYDHGIFLGRFIFKQGASSWEQFQSAFDSIFTAAQAANHANLSNLTWTSSGHSGTANTLAGFDDTGAATEYTESNYAKLASTQTFTGNNTFNNSIFISSSAVFSDGTELTTGVGLWEIDITYGGLQPSGETVNDARWEIDSVNGGIQPK